MEMILVMEDPNIYKHWVWCQVCVDTYTALNAGFSHAEILAFDHITEQAAELDRLGRSRQAEVYIETARRAQEDVLSGRAHLTDQERQECR